MLKVLIAVSDCGYGDGVFHLADIKYIDNPDALCLDTIFLENFPFCPERTVENLIENMSQAHLLILPFHSSSIVQFLDFMGEKLKQSFWEKTCKKVVWTLDNHLFPEEDRIIQGNIDKLYFSHLNYSNHLDSRKSSYLPSAYYLTDIDSFLHMAPIKSPEYIDVLCNFRYFPEHLNDDDRAIVVYQVLKHLEKYSNKLNVVCGSIANNIEYINALRSSKIILNVSMMYDFNIRNFEALAFDKVLLASYTSVHEESAKRLKLDFSKTVLFDRNCSDFDEKLKEALSKTQSNSKTFLSILNGNMLLHRYLFIVNDMFGTNLKVIPMRMNNDSYCCYAGEKLDFKMEKEYSLSDLVVCSAYDYLKRGYIDDAKYILGKSFT